MIDTRQNCFTREQGVTLRDYIESRLAAMDEALNLARDNLNMRMDGFPEQFVRKGDTDIAIAQLAAEIKTITNSISELKSERMSRLEFSMQHAAVVERITSLETNQAKTIGRQGLSTPLVAVMAAIIGAFLGFGLQLIFTAMSHFKG